MHELSAIIFLSTLLLFKEAKTSPLHSDTIQLADDHINNFPAIRFGDADNQPSTNNTPICKTFPGDTTWPSETEWSHLNESIDGVLLKPKPAAAVCYPGPDFDSERCQFLVDSAARSRFWLDEPLVALTQWTQGSTCVASLTPEGNCTQGGFPVYVVNATTVKHVQAAVNFARNNHIRLIIKNTGHDFGGRSVGAGSLSVWTHYLKDIEFLPTYSIGEYTGMAIQVGSGVEAWEVYNIMAAQNATAVAAGCSTVGGNGGWMSSGGHSSITSSFGLGADQVLSLGVVTADGRFVTADPFTNQDLFFALRGGGGATYGIITSAIMKAYPPVNMTTSSLSLAVSPVPGSGSVADVDTFWQGVGLYYRFSAEILDAGGYGFSYIFPMANNTFRFTTSSQFPGKTSAEVFAFMQPLYEQLASLGINATNPRNPSSRLYGSPGGRGTGDQPVNTRYRSRLLPRANWEDDELFERTVGAIRTAVEAGFANDFHFHGTLTSPTAAVAGWPGRDAAVNPAWRSNRMHAMLMDSQPAGLTARQARDRDATMQGYMDLLRRVSPSAGSYMNEGDPGEPDWQQAFYGANYPRLLEIKRARDPWGVFWAPTTVGSEGWAVDPVDGYPNSQNGRLCQVDDA
ncbi:hypothetical protein F4779DRAFT_629628 [Xylariaceae sp. FL0662B]|nr:hypothetical protein F4779DRAFT_629628 [Xylariaceae sp. FL0662B]